MMPTLSYSEEIGARRMRPRDVGGEANGLTQHPHPTPQAARRRPARPPPRARRARDRQELGEILEAARQAVLTHRQDRIVELWTRGWSVPEIGAALKMPVARVSDEKYKALRKLERHLAGRRDDLDLGP